ncbi:MAG: alpha-L-fucosidase [Opitutaceae bacterium]|nr:alpha-L-fucosidase [Opitutaceae bacterium]
MIASHSRPLLALAGLGIVLAVCGARAETGPAAPKPPPAPRYQAAWESLDTRPTPSWFLDAKFGVFIHWGVYSVPAWGAPGEYAEWYWRRIMSNGPKEAVWRDFHAKNYGTLFNYMDFAPRFTAELFDAAQWVDLFARAGIKYVVPTSKHHDGFALWPSAEATRTWGRPWNALEIGPRRDLMKELADASRARGLRFGFYYSLYEWFNPLWLQNRARYVTEHMTPQFKDVVSRYAPDLIFADGEWDMPSKDWKSEELLAWLFNDSPSKTEVVINDRWGKDSRHKHGGYWTTEYAAGLQDGSHPWEESRGMAASYGLNRAERVNDYKSSREFILVLVDLVSRGGNLLLDIGPAADGTIPPLMEQRLLEMGDWLKVNGEAIYGTRTAGRSAQWTEGRRVDQEYGEYRVQYNLLDQVGQAPRDGRAVKQVFFTQKPDALYAISVGWPGSQLVLRDVSVPAGAKVTMLGVAGTLASSVSGTTLTVTTPALGPDEAPCRHAFVFKIPGARVAREPAAPAATGTKP